jgi:hypothetical protein
LDHRGIKCNTVSLFTALILDFIGLCVECWSIDAVESLRFLKVLKFMGEIMEIFVSLFVISNINKRAA